MTVVHVLAVVLATVALALLVAWGAIVIRLRSRVKKPGSFSCYYRPDIHSGWTEGVAVYGAKSLTWYRLVSLRTRPDREWARASMMVGPVTHRATTKDGEIVEVRIQGDGHRFFLEMSEADYNGLVAWSEAGAPQSASFV